MRDGEGIVWEGQVRSDCNEECDKREREGLRERERESRYSLAQGVKYILHIIWIGKERSLLTLCPRHTHTHTHTLTHAQILIKSTDSVFTDS